ncbi:MAG: hypothetical protein ABI647_00470 [Gemmatimonadota bacterium]
MTLRQISPIAVILLLLGGRAALAQEKKEGQDDVAKNLFAPELVLKHQQEIELKPAQRAAVLAAIKQVQTDLIDLQLNMAEQWQGLVKLLEGTEIDEKKALEQVDKVLTTERDIKRMQLSLLLKIKNTLTRDQQARLRSLRDRPGGDGGGSAERMDEALSRQQQ